MLTLSSLGLGKTQKSFFLGSAINGGGGGRVIQYFFSTAIKLEGGGGAKRP